MRLIDADALMQTLGITDIDCDKCAWGDKKWSRCKRGGDFEDACFAIYSAQTIEERKKGEWIELTNTNHTYVCSVCGRMLVNITDGKNTVTKNYPFCHCGADMRGEERQ